MHHPLCEPSDRVSALAAQHDEGRAIHKGRPATGPTPTDRGKPGTKRHLVTDARGTPLGFCLSGANRHDTVMMAATLDTIPSARSGRRGRP